MNKWAPCVVVVLGLVSGAALAGCSSDATTAAPAPDRNAAVGVLPTQICLINNSSTRTEAEFTKADSAAEKQILWENSGGKLCGIGSFLGVSEDVLGTFQTTNPDRSWKFYAVNKATSFAPSIGVGYTTSGEYNKCIYESLGVNESVSFTDGFVIVTAKRLPDTSAKEFEIVLSNSANDSTTREARTCQPFIYTGR